MSNPTKSHPAPFVDPALLAGIDMRTRLGRTYASSIEEIETDLGGPGALSHIQRALVRQLAWLEIHLDGTALQIAQGQDLYGRYSVLANSFAGLAAKLGLRRQMRNLSLDAYAEQVRNQPDGRQQDD